MVLQQSNKTDLQEDFSDEDVAEVYVDRVASNNYRRLIDELTEDRRLQRQLEEIFEMPLPG